jgi:hypothetical protein
MAALRSAPPGQVGSPPRDAAPELAAARPDAHRSVLARQQHTADILYAETFANHLLGFGELAKAPHRRRWLQVLQVAQIGWDRW